MYPLGRFPTGLMGAATMALAVLAVASMLGRCITLVNYVKPLQCGESEKFFVLAMME
jgi:hypothetical protein